MGLDTWRSPPRRRGCGPRSDESLRIEGHRSRVRSTRYRSYPADEEPSPQHARVETSGVTALAVTQRPPRSLSPPLCPTATMPGCSARSYPTPTSLREPDARPASSHFGTWPRSRQNNVRTAIYATLVGSPIFARPFGSLRRRAAKTSVMGRRNRDVRSKPDLLGYADNRLRRASLKGSLDFELTLGPAGESRLLGYHTAFLRCEFSHPSSDARLTPSDEIVPAKGRGIGCPYSARGLRHAHDPTTKHLVSSSTAPGCKAVAQSLTAITESPMLRASALLRP